MVRFVPAERIDPDQMLAWRNDPAVTKHLARSTWSREDVDRWFGSLGGTRHAYAVEVEGQVIGVASLDDIDETNRKCQAAVIIGDTRHWGRGIGTQAAELVTAIAFQELGMHRVLAVASERNPASIRCFQKAGYREEGRLRHATYRDGQYDDLVLLSILAPEWRGPMPD